MRNPSCIYHLNCKFKISRIRLTEEYMLHCMYCLQHTNEPIDVRVASKSPTTKLMDVGLHIRLCDIKISISMTRYFSSVFRGKVVRKLEEGCEIFRFWKQRTSIGLSLDKPKVNWNLFDPMTKTNLHFETKAFNSDYYAGCN